VQTGDTLRSLAQRVYGNSNLWYVLAEANALQGDGDLVAGSTLKVPEVKVTANDSNTFKPFNPGEAIGNTAPGLPYIMSRFDVTRGVDFMAYSKPRVRGAVFNGMRVGAASDSAVARLDASAERLESLAGRDNEDPLSGFIDEVLGLAVGYLLDEGSDPLAVSEHGEVLLDALQELPSRQREIVIDHYLRQIPFQTIAQRLKLSKGRVSQIHKDALRGIRSVLEQRRYGRDSFF